MSDNFNVCIVGKPNVGKSTIFNKILGSDISKVSEVSGTTVYPVSSYEKINDIFVNKFSVSVVLKLLVMNFAVPSAVFKAIFPVNPSVTITFTSPFIISFPSI